MSQSVPSALLACALAGCTPPPDDASSAKARDQLMSTARVVADEAAAVLDDAVSKLRDERVAAAERAQDACAPGPTNVQCRINATEAIKAQYSVKFAALSKAVDAQTLLMAALDAVCPSTLSASDCTAHRVTAAAQSLPIVEEALAGLHLAGAK